MEVLMPERRRSLLCVFMAVVFFVIPSLVGQTKSDVPAREQLIGAWRLVSIETVRPYSEVIYPFYGKHPQGLIMYDRSGWMSVQIRRSPDFDCENSRDG